MQKFTKSVEQALEEAKGSFADILKEQGRELLEATDEDLHKFAIAITNDAAMVPLVPYPDRRKKLIAEITSQLEALAELHRIRATNAAMETYRRIVLVAIKTLVSAYTSAV